MLDFPAPATGAASPQLITERLSDRLAGLFAQRIGSGDLRPGDRLPTEQQIALAHGVSRTVVREGMHQLKSRQLVRSREGSGVYVATPPPHQSLAFDPSVLDSVRSV